MNTLGLWEFIPGGSLEGETNHRQALKNSFYLRNTQNGEMLFASTEFIDELFQKRRQINTKTASDKPLGDEFVWVFKRHTHNSNRVHIFNLKYDEPLYAGSFFYKNKVMTWWKKPTESRQFLWRLSCLDDMYPIIVS